MFAFFNGSVSSDEMYADARHGQIRFEEIGSFALKLCHDGKDIANAVSLNETGMNFGIISESTLFARIAGSVMTSSTYIKKIWQEKKNLFVLLLIILRANNCDL